MTKKRGQITVFIIIGLVILLTYFLLMNYRKESIKEIDMIQPEFIPIQDYVTKCTENLAREAIDIIGINGGYIYFPPWVQTNPNSYLKQSPIDSLKNPYWWFDGTEAVPTLEFMTSQIEQYTKEGISGCVGEFSNFKDQYDIIPGKESFEVITDIGEEDITVKTIYPIEIRDKFNKTLAKITSFPVKIPIRLKKVHSLAKEILYRENRDYFIEKKAIDLISLDDDEVPTTGIAVQCGKKQWETGKVEKKIKQLLEKNLDYIKLKGSKYYSTSKITPYQLKDTNPYSKSDTFNESYYNYHYIWDVTDQKLDNMHISFFYDQKWPIKFAVRPSSGKVMRSNPQMAGKMLSAFCLHIWHFTYDVVFPVKVSIYDEKTERSEPYTFTFAFNAQINHNEPDRSTFASEDYDTTSTIQEEEYCADVRNRVTIYAVDKVSRDEMREANLTFTCGRFICSMGMTDNDWKNDAQGTPQFTASFPYCMNGIIRANKPGYEEGMAFIQTGRLAGTEPEDNIGGSFTVELRPVKEMNYTVVKHKIMDQAISGPKDLDSDEKAVIMLKNDKEAFNSESTYFANTTIPIKILDGAAYDYDLEIYVIDNESISAGYKNKWSVTQNDLVLGKNITFHILYQDFKDEEDRLGFLASIAENSKKLPPPEIKTR